MTKESNLTVQVNSTLNSFVETYQGTHSAEDIYRCFQEQASLLLERQQLVDLLTTDPFQHFSTIQPAIQRLIRLSQVISCNRIHTKDGYCSIEATVRIPADQVMQKANAVTDHVALSFQYERLAAPMQPTGPEMPQATVWYAINFSKDYGPQQRLLCVQVWAAGHQPSSVPAHNLEADGDWSNIDSDDDDDDEQNNNSKNINSKVAEAQRTTQKQRSQSDATMDKEHSLEEEECDRFAAHIDPEVMYAFLEMAQLGSMDDATAFFLLMTFPFYEHEWDLVGFILDGVFGSGESDDEQNAMETEGAEEESL